MIAMTKKNDITILSIVHPICCALDVHKKSISACLVSVNTLGEEQSEVREFGTFTDDLIKMRDWLLKNDCPIIAMESTGVYWRPVHNILEGYMEVILANARHIKNVPGRKTDISDCKWLAGLLRHGLIKGSFIPEKKVRQWRELTRLRRSYTEAVGDHKRRVHKLFECANIKIDSVVSDLFGKTGRNLITLLCEGKADLSLKNIQECAHGSLKEKGEELYRSIQGFFEEHHRFQLKSIMRIIAMIEGELATITARLSQLMEPYQDLLDLLDEIPGIDQVAAQSVISEIGVTLEAFVTTMSFTSWAGLCPGNNQSGGKRKSGKSPVRKHPFKTIMIQIAWAAIKKKNSYYKNKYYLLKARRGPKKAIVAIAHRIAKVIYSIIKTGEPYQDLGEEYLMNINKSKRISHLQKQAHLLGFELVPAKI